MSRLCVLVALLIANLASADKVALLPIHWKGDELTPPQRERLRSSLRGGLAAAAAEPVEAEPTFERAPALRGCETAACWGRLADMMDVPLVLDVAVEVVGSSNFTFALQTYARAQRAVVAKRLERCEICNAQEANETLSRAVGGLLEEAQRAAVAPSPTAKAAPTATAVLLRPPRRPLQLAAIGLGASGALLLAGGAALLAVDGGHRSAGDALGGTRQQTRLDAALPGGILVGIGAASVLSAAILGWWSTTPELRKLTQALPLLVPMVGGGGRGVAAVARF